LTGLILQRRDQIGARAVKRRKDPEQHARAEREDGREQHHHRIERRLDHFDRFRGEQRQHQVQRPAGDEQAGDAAERREQARLGEELRDQLPPRRAEREADGHLARAGRGASEQQVRNVRARDQQHECRDAQQQHQRRSRFA
jgi:hypothetical protein